MATYQLHVELTDDGFRVSPAGDCPPEVRSVIEDIDYESSYWKDLALLRVVMKEYASNKSEENLAVVRELYRRSEEADKEYCGQISIFPVN
jgi:hypothetical protein